MRRGIVGLLFASLLALAVHTGVAEAAGVFHPIRNTGNGKCLQPQGGSTGHVAIVQMPCVAGSLAQGWHFERISGNDFRIINQLSGFCVYMNGPVQAGSPISQAPCDPPVSNHTWRADHPPASVAELRSMAGGNHNLCLDVPGGSAIDGLGMQTWTCNGTPAQRWIIGF